MTVTQNPAQGSRLRSAARGKAANPAPANAGGAALAQVAEVDPALVAAAGDVHHRWNDLLTFMAPEIERTLPAHMSVERMTRVALTVMRQNPQLQECSAASVVGALLTAAQLGLEPGPLGHCYLVPFKNWKTKSREAQFILGYKGMVDLARRSGELRRITTHTVYQREVDEGRFSIAYGWDEKLTHAPLFGEDDRGPVFGYYAYAWLQSGEAQFKFLTPKEVDKFRRRSPTQRDEPSGPWVTDFEAMAWKTCVRRLSTLLPQSVAFAAATSWDDVTRNVAAPGDVLNVLDMTPPQRDEPDELDEPAELATDDTVPGEIADPVADGGPAFTGDAPAYDPAAEPNGWNQ